MGSARCSANLSKGKESPPRCVEKPWLHRRRRGARQHQLNQQRRLPFVTKAAGDESAVQRPRCSGGPIREVDR